MKIRITPTILEEFAETCAASLGRQGTDRADPSDPVYLKIHGAELFSPTKAGVVIDATPAEVAELKSRAEFDIETCQENMEGGLDFPYWAGRLSAFRALLRQTKQAK